MLEVVFPIANIPIAISKVLGAFTMHFSCLKITFIPRLIRPDHDTFAIHVVIFEFTLIELARISKVVLAVPVKLAVNKVSFIVAPLELKSAIARLFSFYELASILDFIIVPALAAVAMLLVIEPLPLVHRAISVDEDAVAIRLSSPPLPLVDVVVRVSHSAFTVE